MAVKKKSTKTPAKATKKPAARKKSAKASAKLAVKKAPTKAKAATRTANKKPAPAQIPTMPQPFLKEMENIMTKQPFQFDQLGQETMQETMKDAANSSREGVEAFVKSGEIFAKGFEAWMKTAASIAQSAGEKQAEYTKQLMSSKTINEYAEAQNKIAQENFDQFMTGATQLSEIGVKVLSEASEPLNEQMTKAMAKANKQMAA